LFLLYSSSFSDCGTNGRTRSVFFQAGDAIPADSIIISKEFVLSNESSLTGEPDDLKKSPEKDCFLLSSCLVTEGEECRALVIGIGRRSQWGKIKANLVTEAVNTPLQDKLEDMTKQVRQPRFSIFCFVRQVLIA
jgi:magnesium-transporting ATPase (P-type)